jgi:acyl carrier protein
VLGGIGFSAYAAANLYMEAFALRHNREAAVPWLAVSWDSWRMEAEERQAGGLGGADAALTMGPQQSVEALRRILTLPDAGQIVVSTGDLEARIEQWARFQDPRTAAAAKGEEAAAGGVGAVASRPQLATPLVAPRDDTEEGVARIWTQLLGIAPIGVHDNFFELGGDSLLATQQVSRLRQQFKVQVTLQQLFESPTVAGLAVAIKSHDEAELSELEDLLGEIEALDEEEAAEQLSGKGGE